MENKDITGQIVIGILLAAVIIFWGPAILAGCIAGLGLMMYGIIIFPAMLVPIIFGLGFWLATRNHP